MITPTAQGAYSLALWLRANAPQLYMALAHRYATAKLSGLGCNCDGKLGQDTPGWPALPTDVPADIQTIDVTGTIPSYPALDTLDPSTLTPITVTDPLALPQITDASPIVANQSPGLLSQITGFLTTGGGITSALNLATAAIQSTTARQVTQAQIARVAGGYNPAAISYRVNPSTGMVTPTLSIPGGSVPVSPTLLQRLAPNMQSLTATSFLSSGWLWLALAGVGALVLLRR
jgi:hypothetical protein